jgi:hypothetical protein
LRGFFFLVGVWVTARVTLVVLFVLVGVRTAASHPAKRGLSPPRYHHIVDVDGVMPRPEHLLIYPQETAFIDEGFHKPHHMPDGESGDTSETLIGNPGMLAKEVGFGENGVKDDAFGAGNLDTAEDFL